jgi:UPF0716 family protein affecting phage T7 exclusion
VVVLLLLILIAVPLAELFVIIQVAHLIGLIATLLALLLISIAGAWLLKREGAAAWRRVTDALARGEMPATEVADGALVFLAGALLLTPGFITDAAGMLLLIPVVRVGLRGGIRKLLWRWGRRRLRVVGPTEAVAHRVYDARAVSRKPSATASAGQLPSTDSGPADEADFPDRR